MDCPVCSEPILPGEYTFDCPGCLETVHATCATDNTSRGTVYCHLCAMRDELSDNYQGIGWGERVESDWGVEDR
jgi:hypothetical protein